MEKIKEYWLAWLLNDDNSNDWWKRKRSMWEVQDGRIVLTRGKATIKSILKYENKYTVQYDIYLSHLVEKLSDFHLEEQILSYRADLENGEIINHQEILPVKPKIKHTVSHDEKPKDTSRQTFSYDRAEAVRYAERWWNDYNPAFRRFADDCTNYISQCLLAGGAPMRGAPNREVGWWYQGDNWSFSWSVAHSLRWYLSGSTTGLQASEVASAEVLEPGDVICYDFQGDGRWDHNTIVVRKDASGMPLVNAHTNNSRNRYWTYEDSAAWTPNIQYKFFRIGS
ncbi:amidase domain-containing protein [Oceanobacillus sp. CAU 1775]